MLRISSQLLYIVVKPMPLNIFDTDTDVHFTRREDQEDDKEGFDGVPVNKVINF